MWLQKLVKKEKDAVIVVTVRDPISQLASWIKAPYNLGQCINKKTFALPGGTPCRLKREMMQNQDIASEQDLREFPRGPTEVWNTYMKGYLELRDMKAAQVLIIPYEDIVLQYEAVIKRIFNALDLAEFVPSPILSVDDPSKTHGNASTRQLAIEKIKKRPYLGEPGLTPDFVKKYCDELDPNLMTQLSKEQTAAASYMDACKEAASGSSEPTV